MTSSTCPHNLKHVYLLGIVWIQDGRTLWLPLLQGVFVWEEVCSAWWKSILCEVLWEPLLQHLWGVQETHWLQQQSMFIFTFSIRSHTVKMFQIQNSWSCPCEKEVHFIVLLVFKDKVTILNNLNKYILNVIKNNFAHVNNFIEFFTCALVC